jgi:hypothetical protein
VCRPVWDSVKIEEMAFLDVSTFPDRIQTYRKVTKLCESNRNAISILRNLFKILLQNQALRFLYHLQPQRGDHFVARQFIAGDKMSRKLKQIRQPADGTQHQLILV